MTVVQAPDATTPRDDPEGEEIAGSPDRWVAWDDVLSQRWEKREGGPQWAHVGMALTLLQPLIVERRMRPPSVPVWGLDLVRTLMAANYDLAPAQELIAWVGTATNRAERAKAIASLFDLEASKERVALLLRGEVP